MDLLTLQKAKKYTDETVVGGGAVKGKNCTIDKIEKKDGESVVNFSWTLDDGTVKSDEMRVKDGLSIKSLDVVDGKLVATLSDGSKLSPVEMPQAEVKVSQETGNALTKKDDGLFVAKGAVEISKETDNAIESKDDGLYVKKTNDVEISKEEGNIIKEKDDGLYAIADKISISKQEKNILSEKDDGLYVPETDLSSYAKKSDLTSVYKYKGSVAKKTDLPADDLTVGDVYNIEETGMNVAWTGTAWDELGASVDLSLYAKSADVVAKNQTEANKGKILIVGNDGNVTTGDAPSGVEVVDIKKADYEKLTDDEVKGKFFNTTDEEDIDLSEYAKKESVVLKEQGTENKGKFLGIGEDGNVTPTTIPNPDLSGYAKLTADANKIVDGTDLNDMWKAGVYICMSGINAQTLNNCPYTNGNFRLEIVNNTGTASATNNWWGWQIITTNNADGRYYIRQHSNQSWTDWVKVMPISDTYSSTSEYAMSGKALASALGTQCTFSLSGTTLTITPKK